MIYHSSIPDTENTACYRQIHHRTSKHNTFLDLLLLYQSLGQIFRALLLYIANTFIVTLFIQAFHTANWNTAWEYCNLWPSIQYVCACQYYEGSLQYEAHKGARHYCASTCVSIRKHSREIWNWSYLDNWFLKFRTGIKHRCIYFLSKSQGGTSDELFRYLMKLAYTFLAPNARRLA